MDDRFIDQRFKKWITVQAYKHDGSLHRQWSPAYLTLNDEDVFAVCSRASAVTEADGRKWMTREHAVFVFFKKKWLNVICMKKQDGGVCYYVNIASPTIMDQGKLKYIDYDLDLKLFTDGTIKELDELEFERHVYKYGYSKELTAIIRDSMKTAKEMIARHEFPFIDSEIEKVFAKFADENKPFLNNESRGGKR